MKLYAAQFALTQDIPQAPVRWGRIGITMMPFGPVLDADSLPPTRWRPCAPGSASRSS